jgi:hypothetical protein
VKTDEKARVLDENDAFSSQKVGKTGGLQLLIGKYAENASN